MKSADYWRQRSAAVEEMLHQDASGSIRVIEDCFRDAQMQVQKDIEAWAGRVAKNNGVSMDEARRMLTKRELEEFRWAVEQYIEAGQKAGLSPLWQKKLENASARFHISRLEAVELQIGVQLELLFQNQADELDTLLKRVVGKGYTYTAFEFQKGIRLGWDITGFRQDRLDALIKKPWTTDGRTFRDRCWVNKQGLADRLHKGMTQSLLLGEPPEKLISRVEKEFGVSRYQTKRLVHTETSYFAGLSALEAYRDNGVKEIEIVETPDSRTCPLCGQMDKKRLPLSQAEPGVTIPPFHPNCRGTTCAYLEDWDLEGERAARNAGGEVYYIPADMSYEQWAKAFLKGDKGGLKRTPQLISRYLKNGVFDLQHAKEDYRKFLQTTPERCKMYLEQSMDAVEYEQVDRPDVIFGYEGKVDSIVFNPNQPGFKDYDFRAVNTHELAHRIDRFFVRSMEQNDFIEAIQKAEAVLDADPDFFVQFCSQHDEEGFLSDIMSAVCKGKYEFLFEHDADYWTTENQSMETFANLFGLTAHRDTEKLDFLKEHFPELLRCFERIIPNV